MITKAEVLLVLKRFKPTDDVSAALKALQSIGGKSASKRVELPSPEQTDVDEMLEAIRQVMQNNGAEFCSIPIMQRAPNYKSFAEKVPDVWRYLRMATKNFKDSDREQCFILKFGVELLYEDLGKMGIVASSRVIMNHVHRIPAVINHAFPGYAQLGLLGIISRTKGADAARFLQQYNSSRLPRLPHP